MPKILAIDDKEDNLITISAILKAFVPGCEVITALSGREGIKKAKFESPDTILLDIKMPQMDGYEVCERLKENEGTKHIPVLMITAIKTDPKDLVMGLESGADAYLAKPIDESVLIAQINTALRVKNAEDQLRNQKHLLEEMVMERTKALRASEERAKVLLDAAFETALLIDVRGTVCAINETGARRLGKSVGELIDTNIYDLLPASIAKQRKARADQAIQTGEPVSFEDERDGIKFVNKVHPVFDIQGKVSQLAIYSRDVTKQKNAAAEKRKLEAQLIQSEKMEAIGTLAGGIAHDFNNILFSIIGFTEMTMDDIEKGSPAESNLKQVHKAGQRAGDLVKQILTFSREDAQEQKPFQVKYVVKEALKFLRASLPSTIEIAQDIQSDWLLMGDSTQIHQVLMNLCTNAGHAMEEKGGVLDVALMDTELDSGFTATHQGLKPGPFLKITVTDTGYGIKPHLLDRIFEPFFTTKQPGEGTGLGLSVVHGIVKSHGGGIYAYSEPGKGSTFHVYLPAIKREWGEESETEKPVPGGTERILFVDDEPMLADLGEKVLKSLGYEVTVRTSSIDALALFRKQPDQFDLVITDMTMPHMTGDSLARAMIKIRSDIPIILCSGYSKEISEKIAKRIGIRAFVMKPILRRTMAKTIREGLGKK